MRLNTKPLDQHLAPLTKAVAHPDFGIKSGTHRVGYASACRQQGQDLSCWKAGAHKNGAREGCMSCMTTTSVASVPSSPTPAPCYPILWYPIPMLASPWPGIGTTNKEVQVECYGEGPYN
eukprot:scaffold209105_cov20-Tisochrysis_lutea.AAC.1